MTFWQSVLAFAAFAAVLTVTPGLDTLLVLRTAAVGGRRAGFAASAGIGLGCLCWAVASALGITAVLSASRLGYDVLRWAGAGYLIWLGLRLLRRRRVSTVEAVGTAAAAPAAPVASAAPLAAAPAPAARPVTAFRIGLTTNLLNPKVGVFYLSVLPQFLPDRIPPLLAATVLAGVHVVEGLLWSAVIIFAVHRTAGWLTRPSVRRRLDEATGVIFVALGLRLAVEGVRR